MLVRLKNDRYINTSQIRSILPAKIWVDSINGRPVEDDDHIVAYAGLTLAEGRMLIDKDDLGKIKRAMYIERCNLQPV